MPTEVLATTVNVAPGTFFAIIAASALAAAIAGVAGGRGVVVPVVVLELLLGVLLGPQLLGLHVDPFIQFFSDLGLGLLFFFAGYEIDVKRIMGQPLRLGLIGWGLSLALAYTIGGVLALMTSTQLPLVLAITTLATANGHMRPSTAAALIGAAVLSTLAFPLAGLRLRGDPTTAAEGA